MCFEDIEGEIAKLKSEGRLLTTAEVQETIARYRSMHEHRRQIQAFTGSAPVSYAGSYAAVPY